MKKNNIGSGKDIIKACICEIGCITFLVILYYVIFVAKGYYHSDCTDTIMWAQASYDAGALMNPDFAYAGLLPFGGQLIMLPFVALFGVGMKAQIIGMTIFFLFFAGAIVLLCRSIGFSYMWTSVSLASVLLLVSSSEKLREIFWGHIIYYSLGVFFLMVGFALVLRCLKSEKPLLSVDYILLFVWTALCSMDGVQLLIMYGIPVVAALFAERFFDFKTTLNDKNNKKTYNLILVLVLGIALGIILGKLANGNIQAGYATAYSGFSSSEKWVDNLLSFFPSFFTLIGADVEPWTLMYSMEGICSLIRIVCALVLIFVPVVMAVLYRQFKDISYRLMILIHHFMTLLILLGWVFGNLNDSNWRLSTIVVTSTILCVMFVRWIFQKTDYKRMLIIVAAPIACVALLVAGEIVTMDKQSAENEVLTDMVEYLEENNLEYGYATFWNANIITMLSDSQVKVRDITLGTYGYQKRLYQSNSNWYENAGGYDRYFVLLSADEYSQNYLNNDNYAQPDEILEYLNYKIMIYDDNLF